MKLVKSVSLGKVKFLKLVFIFFISSLVTVFINDGVCAQDEVTLPTHLTYEGDVKNVMEEVKNTNGGYYQKLEIEILDKDLRGKVLNVLQKPLFHKSIERAIRLY